ncbi:hypothetical protein KSP39_PZI020686 [Platanthera zijinensis]|uniref:Uncharacterized protein n=1 Tax=Platanthera zijinensis TaxID=2320716 RepID=A0AAP0AZQ0_9ASPA
MFGKLGRGGGGRGSGKRPLSTPSQLHRPGNAGGARPQIGAPGPVRARPGAPSLSLAVPGREETFSLEQGELDLGAIIRLTPDIVKEIKRLEAQGGSAKIKFDANANNSDGNVVEVGGKEFRFTWSLEHTDLCDIYEERRNGDDGDGLLIECGTAWRKLNVQRILDESTKNHVKMRSEEAERMLKSRKTIVLDPTNPSVKNQAKSMAAAAVEGNMRRMGWKQKEMVFKKRKIENSQGAAAVSQSKFVSKSAAISNGNFKGIPSPVPSPQQARPRGLLSNSGIGKTPRGDTNPGAVTPLSNVNKEEIDFFVKEMANGVSGESMQEINGYEEGNIDPPVDLQSMLITLLSQNPKGMSLKAIEKVLGETVPNSMKKIENALKNVATLQPLGRYFLKQGGQIESSTRCSEGGSSPECSKTLAKKASSVLPKKAVLEMLDQETRSTKNEEASDLFERINIVQDTEDPLDMDEKARDNSVVKAGSLSESGSDSDSESSSSGSDSESQSRSKAGSGSASSSDSESDVSSSSKEASDVDVDIMTSDDERGVTVQNIDVTASRLSPSPRLWKSDDEHGVEIDINERDQKSNGASPALNLTTSENIYERVNSVIDAKEFPIVINGKTFEKLEAKNAESIDSHLQQSKPRSSVVYADHNKVMENQHESPFGSFNNDRHRLIGRSINEEQILMKGGSEQQDNHESVNKLDNKRSLNSEFLDEKSQNAKRIKTSSSVEATFGEGNGGRSSKISCSLSPERSCKWIRRQRL